MRRAIILVIIGVAVVAAGCYWYLSTYGFSAREKPSALETMLARNARRLATPRHARTTTNQLQPTPENISEARDHFADHCATCHANDGSGETQINSGLYPAAPDLRKPETQKLTDGEIFYIIKNGVRFTGMPGWGGEDAENWRLVLFIRHLPRLTEQELKSMREINRIGAEGQPRHHH
jgi:mono/diheme cytochrome c family protein